MRSPHLPTLALALAAPAAALAAVPDGVGVGVRVDDALAHAFARAVSSDAAPFGATLFVPVRWGRLVLEPELAFLSRSSHATQTFPDGRVDSSEVGSSALSGRLGAFWRLERGDSALWLGGRVGARRVDARSTASVTLGDALDSVTVTTARTDALAGLAVGGEVVVAPALSLALEARVEGELLGDVVTTRDPVDAASPAVESGAFRLTPALAIVARIAIW